jgi:hypothetical protein
MVAGRHGIRHRPGCSSPIWNMRWRCLLWVSSSIGWFCGWPNMRLASPLLGSAFAPSPSLARASMALRRMWMDVCTGRPGKDPNQS